MNTATRPAGGGSHWYTSIASTKQIKDGAGQTNVLKQPAALLTDTRLSSYEKRHAAWLWRPADHVLIDALPCSAAYSALQG